MKKILSLIAFISIALSSYGQYTQSNSFIRQAIVSYKMGNDGYYYKTTDVMLDRVDNVVANYAYDPKAQNLYVQTENSNCVVTLTKDYAKVIKKNKSIPQFKGDAINPEIERVNAALDLKFDQINNQRRQHVADSIAKAKADSIAKAKADSIAKAKADSIRIAKATKKKNDYINNHKWFWLPINREYLNCTLCDESVSYKDSILCFAIKNDTIYSIEAKELALDVTYHEVHTYPMPTSLKNDDDFKYHYEVYSDSLKMDEFNITDSPALFNYVSYDKAYEKLKKEAPYGYFDGWGWDDEYISLSFNFRYVNTNKKTIKYIDVYFVVTNDVGDVRKTGNFKGTGPLDEGASARWEWEHSSYYVAGDASNMSISKVIITYMDGTQKTLTKNMLRFN